MSGYVLVLADRRDLGADHLVVALAELDADVVRVEQHLALRGLVVACRRRGHCHRPRRRQRAWPA